MDNLDKEIAKLKDDVAEMINLVLLQVEKTRDSVFNKDIDLAYDVKRVELRVDVLELSIEKNCGNIIALMSPVASDMRFVLAVLHLINDIERVGDNAHGIAEIIIHDEMKIIPQVIQKTQIDAMFTTVLVMLNSMLNSFLEEDSNQARKIFKMDLDLNKLFGEVPEKLEELFNAGQISFIDGLHIHSIARKLERIGDLVKNVGESIIYSLEAKVLKHKDTKKRYKQQ